jgi:release factor glutamine methyltransferase
VQIKKIVYNTYHFTIYPQVYEPADDTFLLAAHLNPPKGATVLDLGTGCGILAILATENADRVIATDINPYAVMCTHFNTKSNNLSHKIEVRHGTLFNPLHRDEKFDQILFNPPYLPDVRPQTGWLDKAWNGGLSGRIWIDPFLKQVSRYLHKAGSLLLIQSSLSGYEDTLKILQLDGFSVHILAEQKLFFETIALIQAIKQ